MPQMVLLISSGHLPPHLQTTTICQVFLSMDMVITSGSAIADRPHSALGPSVVTARCWLRSRFFPSPPELEPLLGGGVPVGILPWCLIWENYDDVAIQFWRKFEDMITRFDRIHEHDRQTDTQIDRQTPHDGTGCACIAWWGKNDMHNER